MNLNDLIETGKIFVSLELKRMFPPNDLDKAPPAVFNPEEAVEVFQRTLENVPDMTLAAAFLNIKMKVNALSVISTGQTDRTQVNKHKIFSTALLTNSQGIIIFSNVPSGEHTEISPTMLKLARDLIKMGKALDIEILDYIVIGHGGYTSLKEENLIAFPRRK